MSKNALIQPDKLNDSIDDKTYDIMENFILQANMPKTMEYILREEMADFVTESPRATAAQIAKRVGCSSASVFNAHKDSRFLAVKDKIQDIYFQNKADVFYTALIKAADKGKVGAIKLGLQVTGKHVDRLETKNMNINADILATQGANITDVVDQWLTMLGNRGWSLEMIADRWRILKSQQAF